MKTPLCTLNEATTVKEVKFIPPIPSHPSLVQIYDMFIDNKEFHLSYCNENNRTKFVPANRELERIEFSRHLEKCFDTTFERNSPYPQVRLFPPRCETREYPYNAHAAILWITRESC